MLSPKDRYYLELGRPSRRPTFQLLRKQCLIPAFTKLPLARTRRGMLCFALQSRENGLMSLELWLGFVAASSVLLVIPGPTLMLVLGHALAHGRRSAWSTVPGVALGDLTAISLSCAGLVRRTRHLGHAVHPPQARRRRLPILARREDVAHLADRSDGRSVGTAVGTLHADGGVHGDGAQPEEHRLLCGVRAPVPGTGEPPAAAATRADSPTFVALAALNTVLFALLAGTRAVRSSVPSSASGSTGWAGRS